MLDQLRKDFRVLVEPGFWITLVLVGAAGAAFFALAGWAMMRA